MITEVNKAPSYLMATMDAACSDSWVGGRSSAFNQHDDLLVDCFMSQGCNQKDTHLLLQKKILFLHYKQKSGDWLGSANRSQPVPDPTL
jgi:hypothetical protein